MNKIHPRFLSNFQEGPSKTFIWRGRKEICSIKHVKRKSWKVIFPRLSSLGFVSRNVTESVSESMSQSVSLSVSEWMSQGGPSRSPQETANMDKERNNQQQSTLSWLPPTSSTMAAQLNTVHVVILRCMWNVYQLTTKAHTSIVNIFIWPLPHSGHSIMPTHCVSV